MSFNVDGNVKSPIPPPLAGGDKGEGEFSTFYGLINVKRHIEA